MAIKGSKQSAEHKAKLSAAHTGKRKSAEYKASVTIPLNIDDLYACYLKEQSTARVGKIFGVSTDTVLSRLKQANKTLLVYRGHSPSAELKAKLRILATDRKPSVEARLKMREKQLGKVHSDDTIAKMKLSSVKAVIKMQTTKMKKYGTLVGKGSGRGKKSWEQIGDQRFYARSTWEANYANYLETQKNQGLILKWEHEPETFWFNKIKRGVRSYLPDFRVTLNSGAIEFHEIKGYMDSKSITKIKRMKIYHPDVVLKVIDSKAYKALEKKIHSTTPNWK